MSRHSLRIAIGLLALSPVPALAAGAESSVISWSLGTLSLIFFALAIVFWRQLQTLRARLEAAQAETIHHSTEADRLLSQTDQLAAVLDAIPIPVWWRGPDLKLLGCNVAYCEALESDVDTILRNGLELGAGTIDENGRGLAQRARQTGMALSESHYVVHTGTRHLLDFTEAPLRGDSGGFAGHGIDVSALENVQSDLASHIAAHGEVLESLATAMAIFGADRRLKFFNTAFANLWGIEPTLLRGEPLIGEMLEILRERRVLPEYVDFPAFRLEQDRLFVSVLEREEELLHLPDGRTLRRAVSPHPFGGLLFVYEDVTDRLVLERFYNTLIEVQRETINNLHEGVAVYGQDGRIRLWNPTLLAMWGLEREFIDSEPHVSDVVDATRHLFLDSEDWPARREGLVLQVTEGAARAGRLERLDGVVLDFACVPLPDGGCLISYVDVTDTVRVQRALEERNIALEMADQVKTEFIANVSYELRTPLNTIAGFTDVLDGELFGTLNPRQKEYISGIVTASRQLMELIDDILDLATIEAGYMALDLQQVEVGAMLRAVRDQAAARIESGRITLEIDCPEEVGNARVDESRMTKALFNLLWNSVMFQSNDGVITMRARRRNGEIVIEVDDMSGLVLEDEFANVYDTFEHGDPYVRRTGAGLGLALTRSLVELHGGGLDILNDPEGGTRAVARLPVDGPSLSSAKARAAE